MVRSAMHKVSWHFDDETMKILRTKSAKRGISIAGLVRYLARALRQGRVDFP